VLGDIEVQTLEGVYAFKGFREALGFDDGSV
jgi:hypothetical protein